MLLDAFHSEEDGVIRISAQQASRFAKEVAGDFNPIHNPDARRFCVPGDLLFAFVLSRFGLSQRMSFRFHAMVGNGVSLLFRAGDDGRIAVTDAAGKLFLEAEHGGDVTHDEGIIESFTRGYVAFSGLNFPHYLKPLMEEQGVMFNPQRPLAIYDSMGFSLDQLDLADARLEFAGSSMTVDGKRADIQLEFRMSKGDETIGTGSKKLLMSGLREYDAAVMEGVVKEFFRLKADYEAQRSQTG